MLQAATASAGRAARRAARLQGLLSTVRTQVRHRALRLDHVAAVNISWHAGQCGSCCNHCKRGFQTGVSYPAFSTVSWGYSFRLLYQVLPCSPTQAGSPECITSSFSQQRSVPAQVQDHQGAQAAREASLRSLGEDRSRLDAALSSIQVPASCVLAEAPEVIWLWTYSGQKLQSWHEALRTCVVPLPDSMEAAQELSMLSERRRCSWSTQTRASAARRLAARSGWAPGHPHVPHLFCWRATCIAKYSQDQCCRHSNMLAVMRQLPCLALPCLALPCLALPCLDP
jgi:hypothetical protein